MCTGLEIAALVGSVASTAAAVHGMTQGKPKTPALPEPEKPPQAAQAPDANAIRRKNQTAEGGPGMSSSSTLLTGPGGVDTGMLNLGRATLLGQ